MRKPAANIVRIGCLVLILAELAVQPASGYTLVDWIRTWPASAPGAAPVQRPGGGADISVARAQLRDAGAQLRDAGAGVRRPCAYYTLRRRLLPRRIAERRFLPRRPAPACPTSSPQYPWLFRPSKYVIARHGSAPHDQLSAGGHLRSGDRLACDGDAALHDLHLATAARAQRGSRRLVLEHLRQYVRTRLIRQRDNRWAVMFRPGPGRLTRLAWLGKPAVPATPVYPRRRVWLPALPTDHRRRFRRRRLRRAGCRRAAPHCSRPPGVLRSARGHGIAGHADAGRSAASAFAQRSTRTAEPAADPGDAEFPARQQRRFAACTASVAESVQATGRAQSRRPTFRPFPTRTPVRAGRKCPLRPACTIPTAGPHACCRSVPAGRRRRSAGPSPPPFR